MTVETAARSKLLILFLFINIIIYKKTVMLQWLQRIPFPTCQTQSKNNRNVGASRWFLLVANADFAFRCANGWPACSHSLSTRASNLKFQQIFISQNHKPKNPDWSQTYPRIVRQSGSRISWANDVTCRVESIPSVPWTRTDWPSTNIIKSFTILQVALHPSKQLSGLRLLMIN